MKPIWMTKLWTILWAELPPEPRLSKNLKATKMCIPVKHVAALLIFWRSVSFPKASNVWDLTQIPVILILTSALHEEGEEASMWTFLQAPKAQLTVKIKFDEMPDVWINKFPSSLFFSSLVFVYYWGCKLKSEQSFQPCLFFIERWLGVIFHNIKAGCPFSN